MQDSVKKYAKTINHGLKICRRDPILLIAAGGHEAFVFSKRTGLPFDSPRD